MDLLPCGHVAHQGKSRLCRHLFGAESDDDRIWLMTGAGVDRDIVCAACDASDEPLELFDACEGCVERAQDDLDVIAIRGEAGILTRDEPMAAETRRTPLPLAVLDIAAVPDQPATWLLLTPEQVVVWNADTGKTSREIPFALRKNTSAERRMTPRRLRIHAAAGGRSAAVVTDYGQFGIVLDLDSGRTTMKLDRHTYHEDTVPFPIAFVTTDSGTLLVHGTAWNRLDVSRPDSGELLTAREFVSRGDQPPEHHSGYFHGRLHLSRSGRYLASDGWFWSPAGMPRVFDLRRWMRDNRWESEDGDSVRHLAQRWYHWDSPMCWADDDRLVVYGIGPDDEMLIPGVRVFDPLTGQETIQFAGPTASPGFLHADGDDLYSADADGMARWDLRTGERTGQVPGFVPTHHHPANRELVRLDGDAIVRWPLPR